MLRRPACEHSRDDVGRLRGATCARAPAASATPSDASCATQPLDRLRARAARGRGRAPGRSRSLSSRATGSLAAIIRCSISRWDSVCTDAPRRVDVAARGRRRTPARRTRPPARRRGLAAALQRGARRPRAAGERLRPRRRARASVAGEDPVDAVVVQALVGADQRAVERRCARPPRRRAPARRSPPGGRRRDAASRRRWTAPRAASARPRPGRRRSSRAGRPRGRRRARAHVRADVGDVDPDAPARPRRAPRREIASSKSWAVAGSIVNVGRSRRSRRARIVGARRARRASRAARSTPGGNARRSPRSSISASMHVARDVRAPEDAHDLRVAARPPRAGRTSARWPGARVARRASTITRRPALEERLGDEEAPALGEQRRRRARPRGPGPPRAVAVAARARARAARAAQRDAPRLVAACRLAGRPAPARRACSPLPVCDAPAAEVAPVRREVLAGGDVERAAVGELDDLLEDALAERARADELRAVAVLQRARDDLRRRGGVAVDEHDERRLAARPGRRSRCSVARRDRAALAS